MKKFYIFRKNICLFIKGYKSRIQTLRFNYNKNRKKYYRNVSNIGQPLEHLSSRTYPPRSRLINFEKLIVQVRGYGEGADFFCTLSRESESFIRAIH